ncbi:hypothetical protein [Nocardia sp. NPDC004711]
MLAWQRAPRGVFGYEMSGQVRDPASVRAGEVGTFRERILDACQQRGGVVKVPVPISGIRRVSRCLENHGPEWARRGDIGDQPCAYLDACVDGSTQSLGTTFDANHFAAAESFDNPRCRMVGN